MGNPSSPQQVANLVISLCGNDAVLGNFVRTLAENGSHCCREIPDLAKSQKKGSRRRWSFRLPHGRHSSGRLAQGAGSRFGTRLNARVEVDPSLIGGCGSPWGPVLDASVRGKLDAMAVALNN
jgi:F-type H+-transporting ATPase subunit delta